MRWTSTVAGRCPGIVGRPGLTRVAWAGAAVLVLAACAARSTPSPSRPARPPELISFDLAFHFDQVAVPGDVVAGALNQGTASVQVEIATSGAGTFTWTTGPDGGAAVRTPTSVPGGPDPVAAIVVWPKSPAPDPLSPGERDFVMGLDFRADPFHGDTLSDDGDNLIQRGRYDDDAQMKLQLDGAVPSCRVVGSSGEVFLAADQPVLAEHWYRLTCARHDGQVRMQLIDLDQPGNEPQESVAYADPGDLEFGTAPLSVAAKVTADGRIDPRSVDQFRGVIDRVYLDVD